MRWSAAAIAFAIAVAPGLQAQGPPTREYTITVRGSAGQDSYRLVVRDSAGAPSAQVQKLIAPNGTVMKLGSFNGGAASDSIIAKMYTLDVWQLGSKEADEGACPTGSASPKACATADHGADVDIVVKSGGEVRTRTYVTPGARQADAPKRAQRLIDFVYEIASFFD